MRQQTTSDKSKVKTERYELFEGDCLEVLRGLESNSVDALVTDPPAGIGFMSTGADHWDSDKGGSKQWINWLSSVLTEVHRVLKPGSHGFVWALPRTSHWTAMAIEWSGLEIRDCVTHLTGQGFPKSLNVNKELEKRGMVCRCERKKDPNQEAADLPSVQPSIRSKDESSYLETQNLRLQVPGYSPAQGRTQGEAEADSAQRASGVDRRESAILPEEHVGPEKPGLEGRRDVQTQQGQLHRPEVRTVPEGISDNGSQGRLCDGTPSGDGAGDGALLDANRGRAPSRSQHQEQCCREPGMVPGQRIPQTCGRCGKPRITDGLGTALKPAAEFWWLIRKPLSEKTVAANVLEWGTGGINIDGCRIGTADNLNGGGYSKSFQGSSFLAYGGKLEFKQPTGRFPANLILDEESARLLDEQTGNLKGPGNTKRSDQKNSAATVSFNGKAFSIPGVNNYPGENGGASRFFYTAKPSAWEKDAGLSDLPERLARNSLTTHNGTGDYRGVDKKPLATRRNTHPTIKSFALMRYLITMISPPGGTVIDPFLGSGTTGAVAVACGFKFIGIEREPEYLEIAKRRIADVRLQPEPTKA